MIHNLNLTEKLITLLIYLKVKVKANLIIINNQLSRYFLIMQLYIVNLFITILIYNIEFSMVPFDKYSYFLFVTILHKFFDIVLYSPCLQKTTRANLH